MKQKILLLLCALTVVLTGNSPAAPPGPAFTYQGRLDEMGAAVTGIYEFVFALYDLPTGGLRVGGPVTNLNVAVSNGLFTTAIDFGAGPFTGADRWLEISVRTNGGAPALLAPRQPLSPAPYALYAPNAGAATSSATAGTASNVIANAVSGAAIQNNAVTAAKIAGGQVVKSLNGLSDIIALTQGTNIIITPVGNNLQLSAHPGNDWHLNGNSSSSNDFLGTLGSVPLDLRVNGTRALRLEPNLTSPNVIGGHPTNAVTGNGGGVIGGGGSSVEPNAVRRPFGTVSGGSGNVAGDGGLGIGDHSVVAGGRFNASIGTASTVGGGQANTNRALFGVVGGGNQNFLQGNLGTIGGGGENANHGPYAVLGGGYRNMVNNQYGTLAGGLGNTNLGEGGSIGGGAGNFASNSYSVIGGGGQNRAVSSYSFVGGGFMNNLSGVAGAVAGGQQNTVLGDNGFVGAGARNRASASWSVVGGGLENAATNDWATVVGGAYNVSGGRSATVVGGRNNLARGENSLAAGSGAQALHEGTFVWADEVSRYGYTTDSNQFLIMASGGVGIGTNKPTSALEVSGTAKATAFCGDGSLLTGLSAANVRGSLSLTGAVPGAVIGARNTDAGTGYGLEGIHTGMGAGVRGSGNFGISGDGASVGVEGFSTLGLGVKGTSLNQVGVEGFGGTAGVHARNTAGGPGNDVSLATATLAGEFHGNVTVLGSVSATLFYGDGGGLTGVGAVSAVNSGQLNGIDGTNYARLDVSSPQSFPGPVTVNTNFQAASLRVPGLIRSGSETNAGQAPNPAGLVIRRLNSTASAANQVVARTDVLTLERDGTAGGMVIRYPANPGQQTIACMAMNNAGTAVNVYNPLGNPAVGGTVRLFFDAQSVVFAQISFGDTYNAGHTTQVTLSRFGNDLWWIGTLTSTFNQ